MSAKWKLLCIKLKIKPATRDTIEVNNHCDAVSCLCAVLEEWLKLNYDYERHGKPSYKKLAEVVQNIDGALCEKIRKKCGGIKSKWLFSYAWLSSHPFAIIFQAAVFKGSVLIELELILAGPLLHFFFF